MNDDELVGLYINNMMSIRDIAKISGIPRTTVNNRLRELIELRSNKGTKRNRLKWRMNRGYIYIYKPEHPNRESNGYMLEHRLVMEEELGRYLTKEERVHHIDGDKINNNPENLYITTRAGHQSISKQCERLIHELYIEGIVKFNKETGEYYKPRH